MPIENLKNNVPSRLLKFLHRDDVRYYEEEKTLRISSSAYFLKAYRNMEVPNDVINDPREGYTGWHQSRSFAFEDATETEKQAVQILGFGGPGGHYAHNSIVMLAPKFHMLCFADGAVDQLRPAFCGSESRLEKPYDACIIFHSIPTFLESLLAEGRLLSDGRPTDTSISHLFDYVTFDFVNYVEKDRVWSNAQPTPSPFEKDPQFAAQREYRVVFGHREKDTSRIIDVVRVYHPDLLTYIEDIIKF